MAIHAMALEIGAVLLWYVPIDDSSIGSLNRIQVQTSVIVRQFRRIKEMQRFIANEYDFNIFVNNSKILAWIYYCPNSSHQRIKSAKTKKNVRYKIICLATLNPIPIK